MNRRLSPPLHQRAQHRTISPKVAPDRKLFRVYEFMSRGTSRAIKSEPIRFRGSYPLLDGRCVANAFKGMNGTPKVISEKEHAYSSDCCRANQDVPFGQQRIPLQARFDRPHRGFAQ